MFSECYELKKIKGINKFNTKRAQVMNSMFNYCFAIEELDLSNFDTSNDRNMADMFDNCNSLKYLNLLNFTIHCSTENMLSFQNKDKCKFITNNKRLLELYNSY